MRYSPHLRLVIGGRPLAWNSGRRTNPYDFNVPITCGGALVRPSDYLIGDADGIVVTPRKWVAKVLKMAVKKEKLDAFVKAKIQREKIPSGTVYPPNEAVLQEFAKHIGIDRTKLPL